MISASARHVISMSPGDTEPLPVQRDSCQLSSYQHIEATFVLHKYALLVVLWWRKCTNSFLASPSFVVWKLHNDKATSLTCIAFAIEQNLFSGPGSIESILLIGLVFFIWWTDWR
jgi:hypothetical protein